RPAPLHTTSTRPSSDLSPIPSSSQGIAIVGMAGRFPGARDIDAFWDNLRNGVESITFFSDDELLAAGVEPSQLKDPGYVKARPVDRKSTRLNSSHVKIS